MNLQQLTGSAQQRHWNAAAAATFPACWTKSEEPCCWLARRCDVAKLETGSDAQKSALCQQPDNRMQQRVQSTDALKLPDFSKQNEEHQGHSYRQQQTDCSCHINSCWYLKGLLAQTALMPSKSLNHVISRDFEASNTEVPKTIWHFLELSKFGHNTLTI